ncbi:efflux RND transporter periplasmic adaptor subunit [Roseospira goensis]|uniref:RND family efflux transporter MFP subunit n=1 Tax=Roseospira goensis TaxID=391922 RepID=A0A7W6S138_9PROT|nr:efflux RND transporter periplasmic adaptor subunit [Roseospira goensis]MBB4286924.1 RND family efflux transporter MFP subunit [Roseospira goensis]
MTWSLSAVGRPPRSVVGALLVAAGLLLASAAGPVAAQQGGGPPATPVGVASVGEREARQTVPVVGRLVARRAGVVAAKVAGAVEAFAVDVGDAVAAGDLLARLDTETARLEVDLASAEVQQRAAALEEARSRLALAQQELQRLASLRRSAAFSQARYDDKSEEVTGYSHAVSVAQAALTIAEARLSLAEVTLRDAEIRAPYPGVVTERHTEVGAFLAKGAAVVSLLNHRDLEVEADLPFDLVAGLAAGETLEVRLDADTRVTAALRAIVPAENVRTRTRPARFTLPAGLDANTSPAAGQSVTLFVPEGPARQVLTVPKDAVINKPTGNMVFVVVDGVAEPRPVTLGPAVGDAFAVLDGLSDGDTVVTRGNERLRPGQPVRPTVPPSAGGSAGAADG